MNILYVIPARGGSKGIPHKNIKLLGGKIQNIYEFELPHSDIERCVIEITKEKNIQSKYPRKAGTPAKDPLK